MAVKNDGAKVGVRFLGKVRAQLKKVKQHSSRVMNSKKKRRKVEGATSTGGLNQPVTVSKPLRDFVGWKKGELHSRTEVTRLLCKYVKDNDLQIPEDRRKIAPDAKLSKLLKVRDDLPLTYTSMQTYLRPHYTKATSV